MRHAAIVSLTVHCKIAFHSRMLSSNLPAGFFPEVSSHLQATTRTDAQKDKNRSMPVREILPFNKISEAVQFASSVDVLRLEGGDSKQFSSQVDSDSSIPSHEDVNEFAPDCQGGTPLPITDMLRERIEELTAEKLGGVRNETHLPRRFVSPNQKVEVATVDASNRDMASELLARPSFGTSSQLSFNHLQAFPSKFESEERTANGVICVNLFRALQRANVCSRRHAVDLVCQGAVTVNRQTERNPFRKVVAEDDIHIKQTTSGIGFGGRLRFEAPRLWMYNKPSYVSMALPKNDDQKSFYSVLPNYEKIFGFCVMMPISPLPTMAQGLVMLSNDMELGEFLGGPNNGIQSTYQLRVRPPISPSLAHKITTQGIMINGVQHKNVELSVLGGRRARSPHSVRVKIRGPSIPVQHLMQHIGRKVIRGGRISFGPFSLKGKGGVGGLANGSLREVAVPPFFMQHVGRVWQPWVERDWPFFRRLRIEKLRRLAQHRCLTAAEAAELDGFTHEEMTSATSFRESELAAEAAEVADRLMRQPLVTTDENAVKVDPFFSIEDDLSSV